MITAKITQQQFDDLAEKLRTQEGVTLAGIGGTVKQSGATVVWSYLDGVLKINVTHAPLGLTGVAENKLRDALTANGVAVTS